MQPTEITKMAIKKLQNVRTLVLEKLAVATKKLQNMRTVILENLEVNRDSSFTYDKEEDLKIFGHLGRTILWGAFAFFVIMLIWSTFAILDEVTVANGKVIPSQKTQVIQNLEGGIVEKIFVKEGDIVAKGQVLAKMSPVRFLSEYREGQVKETAFKIKEARLEAEVNDKPFYVAKELKAKFPELVKNEQKLYDSRKYELNVLSKMRASLQKEIDMTSPLVKDGSISQVEVLHLQQRLNEVEGNIGRFHSITLQELNAVKAEISRLKENNLSLQDRVDRTVVRSPVRGIVKQVYVFTSGGVINPGMALMEIVPLDDTLLIEAMVNPRDIGFLHPKQDAMVKISAYDFSIYGGLPGKVEHISADTTTDQKGNSFYEIWVRTEKNYLEKGGRKMEIIPGMQASVDVLTGHKSVFNYIMKPILKAKQQALRER